MLCGADDQRTERVCSVLLRLLIGVVLSVSSGLEFFDLSEIPKHKEKNRLTVVKRGNRFNKELVGCKS